MSYTFGGPELLRRHPETTVGSKDDDGLYIPVQATVRILLRVPERIAGKPGMDIDPDEFEPALRQACAEGMHGIIVGGSGVEDGFLAQSVCVQEFQPGGA